MVLYCVLLPIPHASSARAADSHPRQRMASPSPAPAAAAPSLGSSSPDLTLTTSLAELGPEEKAQEEHDTRDVSDEPYTIYSNTERWWLVIVVAVAGLFS